MGKYNLGISTSSLVSNFDKRNLSLNEKKAVKVVDDMEKQLNAISKSLAKINLLLNEAVSSKYITGTQATAFKGWAKKCKAQSGNAKKLGEKLDLSFHEDLKNYPIVLLDRRIAELEKKINSLSK